MVLSRGVRQDEYSNFATPVSLLLGAGSGRVSVTSYVEPFSPHDSTLENEDLPLNKILLSALLATALPMAPAFAQDAFENDTYDEAPAAAHTAMTPTRTDRTGLSVSLGGSTLGATAEVGYRFTDKFGLRGMIGEAGFDYDETSDGEEYRGQFDAGGAGLLADFYPFGGSFRLSGGVFETDYKGSLFASNVDFGGGLNSDITVDIAQKEKVAPALTVGYQGKIGRYFTMSADAGAIFGKGFDVSASESSGMATQGQIDNEIADIRDAANDIEAIPFVKLMIGLEF
jgi:hypothetical protein